VADGAVNFECVAVDGVDCPAPRCDEVKDQLMRTGSERMPRMKLE
jgi:hypothetical protein